MRTLVIFESMFGNTKAIAEAVAEGLAAQAVEVGMAPTDVDAIDLLVVGGPTHAFGLSRPSTRADAARQAEGHVVSRTIGLREWIDALPAGPRMTAVATFDTRIRRPRIPGSAAHAAEKGLRRHGFRSGAPAKSFYVDATKGPLFEGEVDRARRWGKELAAFMERESRV